MSDFDTRCVHGAGEPDPVTGAVVPAISLSSTFAQDAVGEPRGFEYSRSGNPTRAALERHVAALEGAAHGFAFASGLAAEDALMRFLAPGDGLLLSDDAYGGTFRLARRLHAGRAVRVLTADLTDVDRLRGEWADHTRMVWIETPTNPLLRIVDIEAIAAVAHERGAVVVVDNTFATPALQLPLALGADAVVHSSTKSLGGHSDVVGGFVAVDDAALAEHVGFVQNAAGAVPGPLDCYLVHRGCRTLHLRMERHCTNAAAVAAMLAVHPAVSGVLWPGNPSHPGHAVAARQMKDFGGMLSIRMRGGAAAARRLCESTRVFTLAESLGAVESLIEHPGLMTHASVAGTPNEVPADLVRLSVGVESAADLLDDLAQALAVVTGG